jgi:transposase
MADNQRNPKDEAMARDGTFNPHPEAVRDAHFLDNPFFDTGDLVQVRYEMVRRHQVDRMAISEVVSLFGVTRPTFYKAQSALAEHGLAGLIPRQRGPKGGHKLSAEVIRYIDLLKVAQPDLTIPQCVDAIASHFGITVHRRSLERAMAVKKKRRERP